MPDLSVEGVPVRKDYETLPTRDPTSMLIQHLLGSHYRTKNTNITEPVQKSS
jgi:hypothetical protein